MRADRFTLPAETYRVVAVGYCGMRFDIREDVTLREARRALAEYLRRRRAQGSPIAILDDNRDTDGAVLPSYEVQSPEDAVLVADTDGYVWIERETVPAFKCFYCDDLVPVGSSCSCLEPAEDA